MNSSKFANLLLAVLTALLIVNYMLFISLCKKFGAYGIGIAIVLSLVLNTAVIFGLTKVKIQNDGEDIQNLNSIFKNIAGVVIVLMIVSFAFVIMGSILAYQITKNTTMSISIALFSVLCMYGSLMFTAKVLAK